MQIPSTGLNPTLLLWGALTAAFGLGLGVSFKMGENWGILGWTLMMVLQMLWVVVAFTPFHEATHGIASRNKKLNELVLLGCTPFFLGDPGLFREIHITHHARTNQEDEDPDHFTSAPTLAGRWFRSFLLFGYYHLFVWTRLKLKNRALYYRSLISPLIPVALVVVAGLAGHLQWVLAAWVIPSLLAAGVLSFVNTAWPHDVGGVSDRFGNTRVHLLPAWAQALMCNQNLHLVHHLQPTLPWWKYGAVWESHREKWIAQGARVVDYRSD